jgi:hypothetical protein
MVDLLSAFKIIYTSNGFYDATIGKHHSVKYNRSG